MGLFGNTKTGSECIHNDSIEVKETTLNIEDIRSSIFYKEAMASHPIESKVIGKYTYTPEEYVSKKGCSVETRVNN